ncbi:hypothetical protein JHK87_039468 [Glycine soja]|nr:hypothetical protein JHK87_039468 [Glycine soja]
MVDENLNLIQQDDQLSSTDDDDGLENSSAKPTTIQDLQTEINNLKREVKELRQQQEIHQIILSQLEEDSDSESVNNSEENQPDNLEDDMFMALINKIKIQKFYINIKIIINDFVLEMMALFDMVLAIVMCISKFQSDLLNQNFLIRVDCKSAQDILQKDVKNLASKQIFARWAPQIHYQTTLPVNSYRKVVIPPKASGISLRGGRSTGKGSRLALSEPTTKKSSTSSGSPTQTGSSTQKTNFEGSSTQFTSIKPEPSTQESPKPATAKQTSADYAWPIETLQALQDMATNPKGKLPLAKAQTPPTKQTNNYIYKNKFLTVLQMEPEFWDKNPFKATAKAFPPGFHYKPTTILKTRTFYELILVDSNSVSIKHFNDPKDQTLNTHSTIQILKVLQPRHFGSDLNKGKRFSVPFDPVSYTYWDYVDAWTKVFWHQNTRFKHSWLIYFKTNTIYNFPNWFLQCFALSWIFSWQYRYSKTEKTNQYPSLQRHTFVKWWSQFDSSKADPEQVKLSFQSHPEFLKATDPETSVFLNQKSHLAAFLAGSKSKEILPKNIKEVMKMLQQEEEGSSLKKEETSSAEVEEEEDPFYQNEDDCFGICLD